MLSVGLFEVLLLKQNEECLELLFFCLLKTGVEGNAPGTWWEGNLTLPHRNAQIFCIVLTYKHMDFPRDATIE